ncbi:MAG: anaerobic ribonucleoside-triphosphate reductase activating protein [Lachnospiraceae bacterium]|nr:anaerobic ribonucleoside-triphosphate reductase activating protein [Lachnospiraceae bacterium]
MNYAEIKCCDIANGPGVRISLFVSGCTHRCKNCFNQMAWDFSYGAPFTKEVEEQILKELKPDYIRGLTLLGGEPMEPENQEGLLSFLERVKEQYPGKDIWCYTGYVFETDILGKMLKTVPQTARILELVDVLVDGPFVEEKKDITLLFRGSSNQRLIDMKETRRMGSVVLWKKET